jgi:hypothetical protein
MPAAAASSRAAESIALFPMPAGPSSSTRLPLESAPSATARTIDASSSSRSSSEEPVSWAALTTASLSPASPEMSGGVPRREGRAPRSTLAPWPIAPHASPTCTWRWFREATPSPDP